MFINKQKRTKNFVYTNWYFQNYHLKYNINSSLTTYFIVSLYFGLWQIIRIYIDHD